jgi:hypothetical protein
MPIEQLLQVVPPPTNDPTRHDWEAIEDGLGHGLPSDYKEIIERYGPGSFGDFLHIYQPNCPWPQLDLKHESEGELWALRQLQAEGQEIPYRLEEPAELLTAGRDENGDPLFWRRLNLNSPDEWTILIKDARAPEWYEHEGGLADFLSKVLSGEVRVEILPDEFPSASPSFQPYGI